MTKNPKLANLDDRFPSTGSSTSKNESLVFEEWAVGRERLSKFSSLSKTSSVLSFQISELLNPNEQNGTIPKFWTMILRTSVLGARLSNSSRTFSLFSLNSTCTFPFHVFSPVGTYLNLEESNHCFLDCFGKAKEAESHGFLYGFFCVMRFEVLFDSVHECQVLLSREAPIDHREEYEWATACLHDFTTMTFVISHYSFLRQ